MKTTEKIFNIQTGEETFLERQMTDEEIARLQAAEETAKIKAAELIVREAARAALLDKLDKLGITADEAKLLLG